jgi:hypothetical protein
MSENRQCLHFETTLEVPFADKMSAKWKNWMNTGNALNRKSRRKPWKHMSTWNR